MKMRLRSCFSQGSTPKGIYDTFRSKISQSVADYRALLEEENESRGKVIPEHVYQHEHHSYERPVVISPVRLEEYMLDFTGPEQVSPHYESFSLSRRVALTGIGGLAALSYISRINDFDWVARSMLAPWLGYFLVLYFFFEGRKYMVMPLQNEWYAQLIDNELSVLHSNMPEDMANASKECVDKALEQLEYLDLHEEFQWIKQNSVGVFLETEHTRLQQHLRDRTQNILRSAESFERINRKQVLSRIVQAAFDRLDEATQQPSVDVLESTFTAGLDAILEDRMTYKNDALLQSIVTQIREDIARLEGISDDEQNAMVALTEAQLKALQDMDKSAKAEFLRSTPPGIDAALKHIPHVRNIFDKW